MLKICICIVFAFSIALISFFSNFDSLTFDTVCDPYMESSACAKVKSIIIY